MAALNRFQSPSAIGQPPFHVAVCGSSWKARCCSVSAALASVGPASGGPAKPPSPFLSLMRKDFSCTQTEKWQICRKRYSAGGRNWWRRCDCTKHVCPDVPTDGTKQVCCVSVEQAATDPRCLRAEGPRRNLRRLSTHSWSRPQRAASLHLRLTLSRATARRLSLVSNKNALVHCNLDQLELLWIKFILKE